MARHIAAEHGLDLGGISGSGPQGRVIRADVEAALAALPPDFRAAVVLCDIEQLSYEEIAATLGVKLGTVRSRISRGRALLRAALADRAPRSLADAPVGGSAGSSAGAGGMDAQEDA